MIHDDDGIHTPFERPPWPPRPPEPIPGSSVTLTEVRANTTDLGPVQSGDEPDPGPGLDPELGQ